MLPETVLNHHTVILPECLAPMFILRRDVWSPNFQGLEPTKAAWRTSSFLGQLVAPPSPVRSAGVWLKLTPGRLLSLQTCVEVACVGSKGQTSQTRFHSWYHISLLFLYSTQKESTTSRNTLINTKFPPIMLDLELFFSGLDTRSLSLSEPQFPWYVLPEATILDWIEREGGPAGSVVSVDRHHPDLVPWYLIG